MFCEKCGAKMDETDMFCENCGAANPDISEQDKQQTVAKTEEITEEVVADEVSETLAEAEAAEAPAEETDSEMNFCENCGAKLEEGLVFCTSCGARLQPDSSESGDGMGAEGLLSGINKSNKLVKWIASIAAIAVVAGVVSWVWPYAANAFFKTILSDEDYLVHVVDNSTEDIAGTLGATTSYLSDNITETGSKGSMKLEVGEGFEPFVDDLGGGEVMEYIDWFEEAEISVNSSLKDEKMSCEMGVGLNGKDITSVEIITDGEDAYIGVPDLNPTYIRAEMPYSMTPAGVWSSALGMDSEEMEELISKLPSEKVIKKLATRYMKCITKSVEKVSEEKVKLEADGVEQKVTCLKAEIDGEVVRNIGVNVLTEAKDDKEIKKIIEDFSEFTDADHDDFVDAVDEALDSMDDFDADYIEGFDLLVYVNGKGEVVGISFEVDGGKFSMYTVESGNKYGSIISFESPSASFNIEGGGKKSGNKYSGTFVVSVDAGYVNMDVVEITLEKVNAKKLQDGIFDGSITISLASSSKGMASMASSYLDIDSDVLKVLADSQIKISSSSSKIGNGKTEISLIYDEKPCVILTTDAKTTKAKSVSVPSKYIDADDYDEMEDWADEVNFDKLIKNLEKAKVSDDIIDELEDNLP